MDHKTRPAKRTSSFETKKSFLSKIPTPWKVVGGVVTAVLVMNAGSRAYDWCTSAAELTRNGEKSLSISQKIVVQTPEIMGSYIDRKIASVSDKSAPSQPAQDARRVAKDGGVKELPQAPAGVASVASTPSVPEAKISEATQPTKQQPKTEKEEEPHAAMVAGKEPPGFIRKIFSMAVDRALGCNKQGVCAEEETVEVPLNVGVTSNTVTAPPMAVAVSDDEHNPSLNELKDLDLPQHVRITLDRLSQQFLDSGNHIIGKQAVREAHRKTQEVPSVVDAANEDGYLKHLAWAGRLKKLPDGIMETVAFAESRIGQGGGDNQPRRNYLQIEPVTFLDWFRRYGAEVVAFLRHTRPAMSDKAERLLPLVNKKWAAAEIATMKADKPFAAALAACYLADSKKKIEEKYYEDNVTRERLSLLGVGVYRLLYRYGENGVESMLTHWNRPISRAVSQRTLKEHKIDQNVLTKDYAMKEAYAFCAVHKAILEHKYGDVLSPAMMADLGVRPNPKTYRVASADRAENPRL